MKKRNIKTFFMFMLLLVLLYAGIIYLCGTIFNAENNYSLSFGKHFHIGILIHKWTGMIAFFSDKKYGPYHGSILQMDGNPPIYKSVCFGPTAGIYYRYFLFKEGSFWTLLINMWYTAIPLGIFSAWVWKKKVENPNSSLLRPKVEDIDNS